MSQRSFFFTKRFLPLFVTQFLGAFSDNVFKNAIAILITYRIAADNQEYAAILVTVSSGLFILPYFLFSATAGEIADKYDKAKLARIYKLLEVVLMSTAAVAFALGSAWFLFVLLFGMGAQSTFFGPIKYSLLPQHLKPHELMAGNAYVEGSTFIAILIGTIIGGIVILMEHGVLIISVILAASAVAGLFSSANIPVSPPGTPDLMISKNIWRESKRIVSDVFSNRKLKMYLLLISWFWLFGSVFLAQTVIFAKQVLSSDVTVVTVFLTLFSIGIALGSVVCTRISKGCASLKYVPAAALGMALFTLAMVIYSNLVSFTLPNAELLDISGFLALPKMWLVPVMMFLVALCGGAYTVPLYTLVQQESRQGKVSRTIAVNNIMNSFFMVASVVVVVIMYSFGLSVSAVFIVIALITAGIAVAVHRNGGARRGE